MSLRLSISLLCDVTLYEFATVYSSILPWMDIYIVSNFGDYKQLDSNLYELRFILGKGYRIYYTEVNNVVVLLLNAGNKKLQSNDISKAKERGILKVFNKYITKNKIPKDKQVWKLCNLNSYPLIDRIKMFIKKLLRNCYVIIPLW